MMPHEEIPIKVNAWVDRGIAPLVCALNRSDDVLTLDSREGGGNEPACIHFACHGGAHRLFGFVHALSRSIGQQLRADNEFEFRLEWVAGSEEPMAVLCVRQDFVQPLARAIEQAEFGEEASDVE